MEGIRGALVIGLVLIAGTAIEQTPTVSPQLPSSSNGLPERREVVPSDTIEDCLPSYPHWKT